MRSMRSSQRSMGEIVKRDYSRTQGLKDSRIIPIPDHVAYADSDRSSFSICSLQRLFLLEYLSTGVLEFLSLGPNRPHLHNAVLGEFAFVK
jgi:hypothetical protein